MFVADQPEEWTILALKRRYYHIDFTDCILQSRIRNLQDRPQRLPLSSSSDHGSTRPTRRRVSIRNQTGQLCPVLYRQRDPTVAVHYQLRASIHNIHRTIPSPELADVKHHLISYNSHEIPPALSSFASLGYHPCNLYGIFSFDKLHLMDLGIRSQFCDLTNTLLQRDSNLPLSHLISIANGRYMTLPQSSISLHPAR